MKITSQFLVKEARTLLAASARQPLSRSARSSAPHRQYSQSHPEGSATWSTREWSLIGLGVTGGLAATLILRYTIPTTKLDTPDVTQSGLTVTRPRINRLADDDRKISGEELGKHCNGQSLWVAIDGEVWDVTDFVDRHPGGSQIIIDNAGKDVSKLFKGIHPAGTLENNLLSSQKIGVLDDEAMSKSQQIDDESVRIQKARNALFGVDSVVCLDDFEKYAHDLCPDAAWDYYAGAAETESALRNNRDAYSRVFFRPRVLRKVREIDSSAEILGVHTSAPFYVSPTARNGLAQLLGEVAVTRGAGNAGVLQVLSHVASRSLEEVLSEAQKGQKIGWQMYMNPDRAQAERDVLRAAELGAQSIWLTVDLTMHTKNEKVRQGKAARTPAPHDQPLTRPKHVSELSTRHDPDVSWEDIAWIKKLSGGLPVVIKGIGAWEDVVLAKQHGADAVVLSNHGGRALDYANAPLQTLVDLNRNSPSTVKDPDFQIFLDGGVRRGTDVTKALCLGARAVGLGRPFIYAAAGWGSEGVERAIQIMREEIEMSMRFLGVTKLDQLGPEFVNISHL